MFPNHMDMQKKVNVVVPTMASTLTTLEDKLKTSLHPKEAYDSVIMEVKKNMDSLPVPNPSFEELEQVATPRNLKQAQNVKAKLASQSKIHDDSIFSLYEICHQEMFFIKELTLYPELTIIFGHEQAIILANRLLIRSHHNKHIEQLLTYDTTFKLGDFMCQFLLCETQNCRVIQYSQYCSWCMKQSCNGYMKISEVATLYDYCTWKNLGLMCQLSQIGR